ncbi:MAG TPA: glycosyltransferase family 8 protein [Gemmatimonadota bacterium]|nr:glycosyltransferase family 8 protein [Gemmatimonadota bacterium]
MPPIDNPVVIACAADERYVMPLAVMLASLTARLEPSRPVSVYVLSRGIAEEDRRRLAGSLQRDDVDLHWLDVTTGAFSDLPVWGRMSTATYHRLMLPALLPPSIDRLIWLDCDLVVNADLARLWAEPLEGWHALAVQDMIVPSVSSPDGIAGHAELGLDPAARYFNAGVMVVNLDLWRRDDVAGRVTDYLRAHGKDVVYWDQEGLNVVLAGRWRELDPRWNQNASVCGRSFYRPRHLDADTYRRVVEDPWIVHFSGNLKPWALHDTGDPARALYFRWLDRTPWAAWRPARTVWSTAVAAYERSRARDLIYPAEKGVLGLARRWSAGRRRRSRRSEPTP